ncbi:MAG: hypothetical protein ACFFD5_00285 [Candidatus Thorarchaeota archaeon]
MDIAKFNKELSYRVAKANGFEKNNKIPEAISEWVAISEMVIAVTKDPKLEFSFRSMLIERTKGIINHIKNLKLKIAVPKIQEISEREDYIEEEDLLESKETPIDKSVLVEEKSLNKQEIKAIDKSEFKNLPKGFKEIKPSDEFEIITPHDKDYVKKLISKDVDMSIFKHEDQNTNPKLELNQPSDGKTIFCFACGEELPILTKICPKCGTTLKM